MSVGVAHVPSTEEVVSRDSGTLRHQARSPPITPSVVSICVSKDTIRQVIQLTFICIREDIRVSCIIHSGTNLGVGQLGIRVRWRDPRAVSTEKLSGNVLAIGQSNVTRKLPAGRPTTHPTAATPINTACSIQFINGNFVFTDRIKIPKPKDSIRHQRTLPEKHNSLAWGYVQNEPRRLHINGRAKQPLSVGGEMTRCRKVFPSALFALFTDMAALMRHTTHKKPLARIIDHGRCASEQFFPFPEL